MLSERAMHSQADRQYASRDPQRPQLRSYLMILNSFIRLARKALAPFLLCLCASAIADSPMAQPVLRDGSCPSGYSSSGNYCTPNSGARFALPRAGGSCPSGYFSSGNYCVASSSSSKHAMPRVGSCPSGYFSSGNFCVASK